MLREAFEVLRDATAIALFSFTLLFLAAIWTGIVTP